MKLAKLYIPAFALLSFGYPLTTVAVTQTDLPIGQINVVLKGIYGSMFVVSIIASLARNSIKIPIQTAPLFLFFLLFGFRLVVDLFLLGAIAPLSSPTYTFTYFFALTLLPAFSVALAFEPSDMKAITTWVFGVLFLSASMIFVHFLQSGSQFLMAIANERLELRGEGEVAARLSAITIGGVGCSLATMSIAQLSMHMRIQGKLSLVSSLAGMALGLGALFLAGSRGPILAFAISLTIVMLGLFRTKLLRKNRHRDISNRSYLLVLGLMIGAGFALGQAGTMFVALDRLVNTFTGLGSGDQAEARIIIALDSLNRIFDSPFFGSGHLALNNTAYAHNSVLEALMATGLFGGMVFITSLVVVFAQVWKALTLRRDPLAFPLAPIVISMLVMSFFSSSISQSPEIWVSVFLFLTITARTKNKNCLTQVI